MNKRDIWICSLLGLGALVMRMLLISKGPFSPESLNLALKAEATLDTMQLQYLFGTGYPLTMMITAASIFIGRFLGIDDPVFAANLMSVYASAASIPLFYLLVKRLTDVPTAVISAVLLAVSPIYLGISVYAKGHALEFLFIFGGMWSLLNYAERREANALLLSAVLFGCLGAVRVQDLAFVLPAAVFMMFAWQPDQDQSQRRRDTFADACILGGAVVVITVAFHLPYLLGPDRAAYLAQLRNFRGLSFTAQHAQSLFVSWPYYREWFLTNFTIYGLIAAALGSGPRLAGQLAGHGLQPAVVRSAVRVLSGHRHHYPAAVHGLAAAGHCLCRFLLGLRLPPAGSPQSDTGDADRCFIGRDDVWEYLSGAESSSSQCRASGLRPLGARPGAGQRAGDL